ncbi:glycoside hydrolase domain-containing protein [Kitasatospora sp. NPDC059571]|uniref:glycoside hydrolase domain-containing protein n=1 Tax=Kitasatospora sp. NPDC059571 TaxID=3346871 RepID=UPI003682948C
MPTRRRTPRRRGAVLSVAALLVAGSAAVAYAAGVVPTAAPTAADSAARADATDPVDGTTGPADPDPSGSGAPAPGGTAPAAADASPSGSASAPPTAAASALPEIGSPPSRSGPRLSDNGAFTGLAFDTCTAPSLTAMNAWRTASPYGAAAVYVGGRNRGCAQPQLSADWVASVSGSGWKLIPLYVGAQPPCQTGSSPEKITADTAVPLGAADGADAVAKASALGMRAGTPLYLDVEAYNTADTACADAVLAYTQSFDRAVRAKGYRPGFYGFASSSAAGIARAAAQGLPDLPDALWYAKYDGAADTTGSFPYDAGLFTGRNRGHQYQVNQRETYGGVTLTVDRNAWDAPVAVTG